MDQLPVIRHDITDVIRHRTGSVGYEFTLFEQSDFRVRIYPFRFGGCGSSRGDTADDENCGPSEVQSVISV